MAGLGDGYTAYLACEPLDPGAERAPGPEALDAGWSALPALSLTRNTPAQVQRLVALEADPAAPAAFD